MEKIYKIAGGSFVAIALILGFTQAMFGNLLGLLLYLLISLFPALLYWGIAAILERINDLEEEIIMLKMNQEEEKEQLSPCPKCGKDVETSRKSCPFCGMSLLE